ncbi:DUF3221 domain-containing protein [Sutcliffiella horikoshii]|uniref:DUF3221 domain-containing protein n=1 Tax=Sutcliffiella horikoshii TaxID=79883 RepID=UPI001F46A79F|nr:DUF3221 domain-containing protein [Sutcliffiella horikoshii]MCG1021472.1 DUF3221 domain-containing protein [Sutcliffiella horikoshii]
MKKRINRNDISRREEAGIRFIALLVVGFLVVLAVNREETPTFNFSEDTTGDAHHLGKVLQKKGETILLEEQYNHYNQPLSKLWVTVNEVTEILTAEGEETTISVVRKGDMVEVWNDGVVLESHPGKTTALKLRKLP